MVAVATKTKLVSSSTSKSSSSSSTLWFETYKNHLLYVSIYVTIISICYQNISTSIFGNDSNTNGSMDDDDATKSSSFSFTYKDIGLTVLVLVTIYCIYFELVFVWMRRNLPPGDAGLPIVGHLADLIKSPYDLKCRYISKFGLPCTFNVIMTPVMLLINEDDVNWAIKEERKGNLVPDLIPFIMDLIGRETVLIESGQEHRRLRKMFEPTFSPAAVKSYTEIIDKTTRKTLKSWSESYSYQTSNEWATLAMKLFFICAIGEDTVDEELFSTLNRLFKKWEVGFSPLLPMNVPGTAIWTGHQGKQQLDKVLMAMIDDFRSKNSPDSPEARSSMLGRLCYDNDPLSDSQIAANIRLIVFAGHDTTKGSFCAFAHFLLNEISSQNKQMLIDEVKSFQEPLDPDELKSAPLLNAFLAETWRLAPPLDSHNLKAVKPIHHPDGWTIPRNARVSLELQLWSMIDETQYPNATEFHIERWLPKGHPLYNPKYCREGVDYNVMNIKYRSFHMGAHMCLGGHFAKLEARIVLTRLLQKYDIELQNESLKQFPLRQYVNEFKLTPKV